MANVGDLEVTLRLRDEISTKLRKIQNAASAQGGKLEENFNKVNAGAKALSRELDSVKKSLRNANDAQSISDLEKKLRSLKSAYKELNTVLNSQGHAKLLDNASVARLLNSIDRVATRTQELKSSFNFFDKFNFGGASGLRNALLNGALAMDAMRDKAQRLGRSLASMFSNVNFRGINFSGLSQRFSGIFNSLGSRIESLRNSFSGLLSSFGSRTSSINLPSVGMPGGGGNGGGTGSSFFQRVRDGWNRVTESISSYFNATRRTAQAVSNFTDEQMRLAMSFKQIQSTSTGIRNFFGALVRDFALLGSAEGIRRTIMSVITVGGEIEKQHIAMQSIIGDLNKANILFGEIKALALQSPFTFSELNRDVKQLAAYGVEYKDLYNTTKRLADISSGLGVSFERIALAYGQTKARSWLDGKELRQFAYAGIPLLEKLAELYSQTSGKTISKGAVQKMIRNREVSFEDVQQVLWNMTDEGGQFYNMQETLSETLLGRYNKLKDAWEIMLADFASGEHIIGRFLKTFINGLTSIVQGLHSTLPLAMALASSLSIVKVWRTTGTNVKTLASGITSAKWNTSLENERNTLLQKNAEAAGLTAEEEARLQVLNQQYAVKNKITAADLQALRATGQITANDVRRLYLSKQITKEVYLQMVSHKRMATFMGRTWKEFGLNAYAAIGLIGGGIKSLGKSMWSMVGGFPGLIMTAGMVSIANWMQKRQEFNQAVKQMNDELLDSFKNLHEFNQNNPINPNLDVQGMRDRVNAMKEELKKELGNMYGTITSNIDNQALLFNGITTRGQMHLFGDILSRMEDAKKAAREMSEEFMKAAKSVDHWDTDSLQKNAKDYADALSKMNDSVAKIVRTNNLASVEKLIDELFATSIGDNFYNQKISAAKELREELDRIKNSAREAGREVEGIDLLPVLDKIRTNSFAQTQDDTNPLFALPSLAKEAEKHAGIFNKQMEEFIASVKKQFQDKGVDASSEIGMLMYHELMQSFFSTHEMSEGAQKVFAFTADHCMGFEDLPSVTGYIADLAMSKLSKSVRDELGRGELLGEPAKKEMDAAMDAALEEFMFQLPFWIRNAQGKLDDDDRYKLKLRVEAQMGGTEVLPELAQWADKRAQDIFSLDSLETIRKKVRDEVQNLTKDGSLTEAQKKNDEAIEKATVEMKRLIERNADGNLINEQKEIIAMREDVARVIGHEPEKDKKTKKSGNKKDSALEDLLRRAKAIERLINLYKELRDVYGAQVAQERTNAEAEKIGIFGYDFGDVVGARQKLAEEFLELYKKAPAGYKDRREAEWQNYDVKAADEQRKKEEDDVKALAKAYSELNSVLKSQYELKESISKQYGKERAQSIAGVVKVYSDALGGQIVTLTSTFEQELTRKLATLLSKSNSPGTSVDEALNMNERQIRDAFGVEDEIYLAIKELRAERQKLQKESIEAVIAQFDKLKGTEADLKRIDNELTATIDKINANKDVSEDERAEAVEIAYLDAMTKRLQMSQGYVDLFNNAWTLTEQEIDKVATLIEENLNQRLKKGVITAQQYREEMKKLLQAQQSQKDVGFMGSKINSLLDAYSKGGIESLIGELLVRETEAKKNGDDEEAKRIKGVIDALQDWKNGLSVAGDVLAVVTSIFDGLATASQALYEMFDALGNEGMANFFSDFTDGLNAVSSVFSGPSNIVKSAMSGDVGGIISNAISLPVTLFTAPITGFAKLHDKKIQREIEASEQRQKEADNLFKNIKSQFDRLLGGGYSDSDYAQRYVEALQQQRDEIAKQMELEDSKKKSDDSKLADYKQQLYELDEQIKYTFEDLGKELYGLDIEGWASKLTNAIVGAWEKGEDAVRAYRDAVNDIMKDVVVSAITQQYMEQAMKNINLEGIIQRSIENGTDLSESEIQEIANALGMVGNLATNAVTAALDKAEAMGAITKDYGMTSGTLTSGIQNITESTADLLASYLNSIRLYVAEDNSMLISLYSDLMPKMNTIAESQLAQLSIIAQNTARSASASEIMQTSLAEVRDLVNAVTNGTKRFYIQ